MRKGIIWFCRLGFAGWLLFEFANWAGLLHVELSFTWFGLIATDGFVWLTLELVSSWLRRRTGQGLESGMYALALAGISFDALGDIMQWYVQFEWYDQLAHALAGGVGVGLVAFNVLWRLRQVDQLRVGVGFIGLTSWGIANLLGAFYEIEEYLEDVVNGTPGKRLGDGPDTANDLLWNLVGAGVAILIVLLVLRSRRTNPGTSTE